MAPLFSIIIPVYNAEKYLRFALDSVLAQTYTNWECICVDDGSTDTSPSILDEYANRDKRFRIVHLANGGVCVARNAGLRKTIGDWVTWLDADDFYAPDRLAEAARLILLEQPDLIRFRTYMGSVAEQGFGEGQIIRRDYSVAEAELAQKWGWNVLMPAGMVWTWVARRDLMNGVDFVPELRVKEDSIYCGYWINRLNKVVQSEYQAYFYRDLATSAIHRVRKADDCIRFLKAVRDLWCDISCKGIPNGLKETIKCRLRMSCEDDIKDWVWMKQGEANRAQEIYRSYSDLKSMGIFDCPSIIHWKPLEFALMWWSLTGQTWPLWLVGRYLHVGRAIKRLLSECKK